VPFIESPACFRCNAIVDGWHAWGSVTALSASRHGTLTTTKYPESVQQVWRHE